MKEKCLFMIVAVMMLVTGCSKVADEKQMQLDLESDTRFNFLGEGEKIKEFTVEKRQTNKEQKTDTIWCTITTTDEDVSCQKEVVLTYGLYDEGGWLLDDVSMNKSSEWIKIPLRGITEDNILASLKGQSVTVDDEDWGITEDNIKNISVDEHNTNLEEKTDLVMATITLNADVEEAKGQLVVNYKFNDGWRIDTISENGEFTATIKPEAALNITDENLIDEMAKQGFQYGETKTDMGNGISLVNMANQQTISVNKSEISDFTIQNIKSSSKGSYQEYVCSCILTKPYVVFNLEAKVQYYYDANSWNVQSITIVPEIVSVNIEGNWKGNYSQAGDRGEVELNITSMADDGTISGIYSWQPDVIDWVTQPGSYYVSGVMNKDTLFIDLKAGEWIDKPERVVSAITKVDIKGILYIDDSNMKGTGHKNTTFTIYQQ